MNFGFPLRILCEKLCVFFAVKKLTAKNTQSFTQRNAKKCMQVSLIKTQFFIIQPVISKLHSPFASIPRLNGAVGQGNDGHDVMVDGSLIDENSEVKEPLIYDSITFD